MLSLDLLRVLAKSAGGATSFARCPAPRSARVEGGGSAAVPLSRQRLCVCAAVFGVFEDNVQRNVGLACESCVTKAPADLLRDAGQAALQGLTRLRRGCLVAQPTLCS